MRAHDVLGFVVTLSLATAAVAPLTAGAPKPKAAITVSIAGLGCSAAGGADAFDAASWSWGASNAGTTGSGGGSGAGRAVVTELSLGRRADACSPALLGGVLTGRHFQTLTLTQVDDAGTAVATLLLNDVTITGWKIGGSTTADATESVTVGFSKFTFTDAASGNKICYDLGAVSTC